MKRENNAVNLHSKSHKDHELSAPVEESSASAGLAIFPVALDR
jgi:hypothetical protein